MRTYDVILYGASSFTGVLVAEYLARTQDASFRWALAGRDREKLAAVRTRLAAIDVRYAALPILVADAADRPALAALVAQTKVICTTVGPYRRHGMPLVDACAKAGTHYCDITGEVPFIRESIDRNHAVAQATGARIVHACGFDSIPSDLGVRLLRDEAREYGEELVSAKGFVRFAGVGAPGGVESALALIEDARGDRALRKLAANPTALDPDRQRRGRDRDQLGARFDRDLGQWTGPFVMAMVNTRVVRRSAALVGQPEFKYDESMSLGRGAAGYLRSVGVTAAMGAFVALAVWKPAHRLLRRLVRPSAPREGHFRFDLLGKTTTGRSLAVRIAGSGDPGCEPTALMVAEAALALANGESVAIGGVLTPATAFDARLAERIRRGGITFEVVGATGAGKQAA